MNLRQSKYDIPGMCAHHLICLLLYSTDTIELNTNRTCENWLILYKFKRWFNTCDLFCSISKEIFIQMNPSGQKQKCCHIFTNLLPQQDLFL